MNSFPRLRKLRLKRHSPRNRTRPSTAIQDRITPSLDTVEHTTMPPRQRLPTGRRVNFYINDCGDLRSLQPFRATGAPSPSDRTAVFCRADKRSRERLEQNRTDALRAVWIKAAGRKEIREDTKIRDRA